MVEDEDFCGVVRSVIRRERVGYWLLAGYYVLALPVTIVSCALQPASAVIVVPAALVIGIVLLTDVSRATRHHLRPLLEHWPSLGILPSGPDRDRRGGRVREPHRGLGGGLYVTGLILLACAGGLTTASAVMAGHPGVSEFTGIAVTSVVIVIVGPLCLFLWRVHEREGRKPYLAGLERALAEARQNGAPAPEKEPARDISAAVFAPHRRWRRRDVGWMCFMVAAMLARVLTLALPVIGAVASGVTVGHAAATPSASTTVSQPPYPVPPVANGVVTDATAGITYAVPPGSGWTEDTNTVYPSYGAEFTKVVPGTSGNDLAMVQSAPLPSGISYQGANGMQRALDGFFPTLVGTYDNDPHDDDVTVDQAVTVCGRPGWLTVDKIHYTSGGLPDETAVLEVISLPGNRAPGTLFASIANTLGANAALDEVKTARPVGAC